MTGFCDFSSSEAISATPLGSGAAARHSRSGVAASTCVSCSRTSIGSATNTGPFGASVATLKARRSTAAISSARSTCTLHLVTGAAIATRSWPSTGVLSRIRVSCWPAVTTSGEFADRKSTRLNSSHSQISYAVFCLKKKKKYRRRPLSRYPIAIVHDILCHPTLLSVYTHLRQNHAVGSVVSQHSLDRRQT